MDRIGMGEKQRSFSEAFFKVHNTKNSAKNDPLSTTRLRDKPWEGGLIFLDKFENLLLNWEL